MNVLTYRMLVPPGAISMKFEADEEDGGGSMYGPVQQRLNLVRASAVGIVESSGLGRHVFFRARKLQRVNEVF